MHATMSHIEQELEETMAINENLEKELVTKNTLIEQLNRRVSELAKSSAMVPCSFMFSCDL